MKYTVVIEKCRESGYVAQAPALKGLRLELGRCLVNARFSSAAFAESAGTNC